MGTPLFAKDGRMSRFTQDGERLVDYARRIVAINDEAIYAFAKPDLTGTISFGTPDDYAEKFLPEILARFARTHPMVTVDVECLGSGELFERCKRGEMDLALVTHGCDIVTEEPVRREKLVWVTSMRHRAHMAEVLPLAVSHAGCGWRSMVLRALDKQQRKYPRGLFNPQFKRGECGGHAGSRGWRHSGTVRAPRHAHSHREGWVPIAWHF